MSPKYYRRRHYRIMRPLKSTKYSSETFAAGTLHTFLAESQFKSVCIPSTNVMGVRKVKNFTLTILLKFPVGSNDINTPCYFALVYIPEGLDPSELKIGQEIPSNTNTLIAESFYEPNQNVIMQGFIDGAQVYRYKSKLARNLNSGDKIMLIWRPFADFTSQALFSYTLNYALAY